MAVEAVQIVTPILLLLGALLFGLLPLLLGTKLKFQERLPRVHSGLVLYAGGVLFGFAFIQVFPDVVQDVASIGTSFPLGETLTCIGFLSVFLAEELFQSYKKYRQARVASKEGSDEESAPLTSSKGEDYGTSSSTADTPAQASTSTSESSGQYPVHFGGIFILFAVSLHYILRAMSLGVSSTASDTWYSYMTIAFQFYTISFVLCILLYSSNTHLVTSIILISLYSLTSPLGAVIGFATSTQVTATASGVLNGLVNGGILYLTFFGILQRQRYPNLVGLIQFLSVGSGFLAILILRIVLAPAT